MLDLASTLAVAEAEGHPLKAQILGGRFRLAVRRCADGNRAERRAATADGGCQLLSPLAVG